MERMIHYSCDQCGREIDPSDELRFVVRLEVFAAYEDAEPCDENEAFLELQEVLARNDDAEDEAIGDEVYQQKRFDLCSECRRAFLRNPLGRQVHDFNFSQN